MCKDDDEFDAWLDEPDEAFEPEIEPDDDDETEPAPGDFWFDREAAPDE